MLSLLCESGILFYNNMNKKGCMDIKIQYFGVTGLPTTLPTS